MKPATHLIKGVLEKLPLLEGVQQDTLLELTTQSSLVRAERGETIVSRGERVSSVYAVAYGSVKTRLRQPQGGETVLALLGPGATFGKEAVLLGRASRLDVVCLADSLLVAIRAACVVALAERNLRFSRNLARALAERNQKLLTELEAGMLPRAQRLAAYLDALARPAGEAGAWAVRLEVSKTLLASRLGMKKETLSRLLRQLAREGLIEVSGRDVAVLDRSALRRRAVQRDA